MSSVAPSEFNQVWEDNPGDVTCKLRVEETKDVTHVALREMQDPVFLKLVLD